MSYEMNEKNGEIPALEDVEVRKGQAGEMTESPVDELQALDKNINSMKACMCRSDGMEGNRQGNVGDGSSFQGVR